MNITEVCIRRPVFAWMMMLATVLFGVVAVMRIGVSQYPDVDFPTITVSVTREGAAPDVMESDVVEQIEEAVMQVEGVRSVNSSARQGSASITIELDIERNVDLALQDVQTRVAQAQRRLPTDIDPPTISKSNPEDQPILWIGLSGPYPRALLTDTAQYQIKERLQTIGGVGEVTLGGFLERNVRIWLNAEALARHKLTPNDVLTALQNDHVERPAGRIDAAGREISVRVMGEAFDLNTLRDIVVKRIDNAPIRVRDVAMVEDGFEDERRMARSLGFPVQGIGVRKQRGANAVAVAQEVRAEISKINETLPEGMQANVVFDSARFIEQNVHHIEIELVLAVFLTALVCWMFLGSLSSTVNVIMAIPMSLFGTIAAIYFLGFTLNTFTLLALSLAVGIVVDDAIMVMENIYRHAEMGKDRVTAAREGTHEITFAALAATIAVVAIFVPVVFIEGVVGKYFLQFGVTLSIAVVLSYVEAITLAPARCAQFLKAGRQERSWLGRKVDDGFSTLARAYRWLLVHALRWSVVVLLLAVGSVIALVYGFRALPGEMVPSQDQGRLQVRMFTEVGTSLDETDRIVKQAEEFINGQPEVARTMFIVGGMGGGNVSQVMAMVSLVPQGERMSQADFATKLRKNLSGIPGLRVSVQDPSQSGFTANNRGFPIELSVRGPDWNTLIEEAMRLRDELAESGLAMDVDTDYELGMPELRLLPKRERAADLGITVDDIATAVNTMVGGVRAGKYTSNGRRVDVRVKVQRDQRSSPDALGNMYLKSQAGEMIPLSALVDLDERPALQSITRRDRERAITITANIAPGHSQSEALEYVGGMSKSLPPGYKLVLGGASASFFESFAGLGFAFLVGVAVAYMVLGSQFNSFLHPFTVLTILPLSLVGAVFALLYTGQTLNIFSMIGLLLLAGIVKKNSIILVEYANHARDRGLSARDAMIEAGPTRLRPILMTSIATMMAAVPAATGLGAGSETRTPMAIAVIGGLVVSTALSLFVVPAFYVVADWVKTKLGMGQPAA
ncbi:MAG TPA: efflux RND transporter permease subunit [Kofleriaceae bacterium]|nr:efflux RND transporter permease subunit [Kofleriaceae bacterium]